METLSALLALYEGIPPVSGGFPSISASNAGFGIFFDVRLNKRFEVPVIWDTMMLIVTSL